MLIHQLPLDAALSTLRSTPAGLSQADATARQLEFGPNRIEQLASVSRLSRFGDQFTHFFAALLWVAAVLALVADLQMPGQGMAILAAAIVAVIVVNGVFSFWQEYRAEQTMAALQELLPHQVRAERDGVVTVIPSEAVVPGDVILLSAGDNVPADCRLLEAFGVRVSNATVTGEARPVSRDAGAGTDDDLLRSRNVLLAGTSMTTGEAKAVVFATGMRTVFGGIAHLTQSTTDAPSPLQKDIAALSRLIAALAVAIGLVVFIIGAVIGLPVSVSLVFSIGIIVANVPEGLLPTVTLAMAMAARRMARRHTLIRHLPSVETLGCATVICTDKTGTLTQNRMAVRSIYVPDQFVAVADAGCAGFAAAHRRFLECARHCHDLRTAGGGAGLTWIGDPMEIALVQLAQAAGCCGPLDRVDEIPFEPERKRLVTVHHTGSEVVLFVKGAPEGLLPRARWIEREGRREALTAESHAAFGHVAEEMADRGLRVLAFAYRVLPGGCGRGSGDGCPRRLRGPATPGGAFGSSPMPRSRRQGSHGDRRSPAYRSCDRARDRPGYAGHTERADGGRSGSNVGHADPAGARCTGNRLRARHSGSEAAGGDRASAQARDRGGHWRWGERRASAAGSRRRDRDGHIRHGRRPRSR
jgi:magnesium-transporting ATPase (P-type)